MKTTLMNDGKALPDGRYGLIIDFEDGRPRPQNVYATSPEALTLKLGQITGIAMRHAAGKMVKRDAPAQPQQEPAAPRAPERKVIPMDPATRMQTVRDLESPEKSSKAAASLVEQELGVPLEKVREMVQREEQERKVAEVTQLFQDWGDAHPEIPDHPANFVMIKDRAIIRANGVFHITHAILDAALQELQEKGLLIPTEVSTGQPSDPPQAPRSVEGKLHATGYRRQDLSAPRPGARTQSTWTREAVARKVNGPSAEYERLIKTDSEFVKAVNLYYGEPQRRAG